ncbi:MAG: prolyl oligopeptidase family serine peptidase [Clostridia bacterium]|nr:prolyl oligopeptidase family serine peptidase [Clostridia bacterium]
MKKKLLCFILLFAIVCLFASCGTLEKNEDYFTPPALSGTFTETFMHNGVTREYIIYIPDNLPMNAPIVVGMHGFTSSPWTFKNNFGWDKLAEENKFIMCYPKGTNEPFTDYSHWNARIPLSTTDDVGFISELALYIADEYQADKNRIFAVGFSNGGYMAYTLACERPDVFRAVASVSGLISEYSWKSYNPNEFNAVKWLEHSPSNPVPVCHIHGTADLVVPIDGSDYLSAFKPGLSAKQIIEFWAGINKCSQKETKKLTKNVTATYYSSTESEAQVWYIEYSGWAHYWPSKDYIVDKPSEINAQDIIWEFFSLYQ